MGAPPIRSAHCSAIRTRPVSGETTTNSVPWYLAMMCSASTGSANRWSTGPSKKPWICAVCRSTAMMRLRARRLEQVGHQPRRDRLAATVLLVLAGVGVEGQHHGDALGRGPLEGVDHDQRLHHPVVRTTVDRLHDERVAPADRLVRRDEDLAVGEVVRAGRGDRHAEVARDLVGEFGEGPPREEHQALAARGLQCAHGGGVSVSSKCSVGRSVAAGAAYGPAEVRLVGVVRPTARACAALGGGVPGPAALDPAVHVALPRAGDAEGSGRHVGRR